MGRLLLVPCSERVLTFSFRILPIPSKNSLIAIRTYSSPIFFLEHIPLLFVFLEHIPLLLENI
jgi:hypothetical protein